MYYDFFENMWVMGRIDEQYLEKQVQDGRISEVEKEKILSTQQAS